MPFCPNCRQEYESFATSCPDCEVPLAAELPAEAPARDPRLALAVLLAESPEIAEMMRGDLGQAGIPVADVGEGVLPEDADLRGLLVPQPLFRQAVTLLDKNARLNRVMREVPMKGPGGEEQTEPIVCFEKRPDALPEEDEIHGSELLQRPRGELLARGAEVVEDLLTLVRRGDEATREQAVIVLNAMGETGVTALTSMLSVLCRDGREGALFSVLRMIRERIEGADRLSELLDVAGDASLEFRPRTLALHALGRSGILGVYERILPLLDDPDPLVREEADETLCTLADEDMGFDPEMPAEERAEVREAWRVWFLDAIGR